MQIKQLESMFNKCSLHRCFLQSMGVSAVGNNNNNKKWYTNNKITTIHWTVTELTASLLIFVYFLHSTYEI